MTVLETFMSFAKQLPADRLRSVESALASVMQTYSEDYEFTGTELQTVDQRLADPDPRYSDSKEISKLFGKPFSA
jgi:hypothetical protein